MMFQCRFTLTCPQWSEMDVIHLTTLGSVLTECVNERVSLQASAPFRAHTQVQSHDLLTPSPLLAHRLTAATLTAKACTV